MKKVIGTLFILPFVVSLLEAGHFFLPQRNLFNIRPDYFVYGSPFNYYPPPLYAPSVYAPPSAYCPLGFTGEFRGRGTYQIIISSPVGMEIIRANTADLIFNVTPSKALVYVDGKLIGNARDFATERDRYMLVEGDHHLRIEFPGYKIFQTEMEIVPNRTLHLDIELEPAGLSQR